MVVIVAIVAIVVIVVIVVIVEEVMVNVKQSIAFECLISPLALDVRYLMHWSDMRVGKIWRR